MVDSGATCCAGYQERHEYTRIERKPAHHVTIGTFSGSASPSSRAQCAGPVGVACNSTIAHLIRFQTVCPSNPVVSIMQNAQFLFIPAWRKIKIEALRDR